MMTKGSKTKTSVFLAPLLTFDTGNDASDILWNTGLFKNAYIAIDDPVCYVEGPILALHFHWCLKNGSRLVEEFDKYENILANRFKKFIHLHTYSPDNTSEIMIFNIPDEYLGIHQTFIEGKYSEFPKEYKKHILKFTDQKEGGRIQQILYKSPILKRHLEQELSVIIPEKAELFDPPYVEQETFSESMKENKFQMKMFNEFK